jgi:CHASE3 domain sensor protein
MGLSNNLSLLKDIETGARGFALTGNIEPNALAKPKIKKYFAFAELD